MNLIIIGNVRTGSSALIDLLSEYSSCECSLRNGYEHALFVAPGGLFHLKDSLYCPNADDGTQDYDIRHFISLMNNLYINDYAFFGGYKKLLGRQFQDACSAFVNSISFSIESLNYSRYKRSRYSLAKSVAQRVLQKNPNIYGRLSSIDHSPFYELCATESQFMMAAKRLITAYITMSKTQKEVSIFDHLLWRDNVTNWVQALPADTKIIYVERDPRDIYLLYRFYDKNHTTGGYPLSMPAFCDHYRSQRKNVLPKNENILTLNFEDLVLDYEASKEKIERFCGLKSTDHINPLQHFIPDISAGNIGLYREDKRGAADLAIIEQQLPEFLYQIPKEKEFLLNKKQMKPF
jgi:hypothetical protein